MRKAAIVVVGLVVVLVVAVAVLPGLIGLNSFKPQIADAVRDATGRELTIGGDIDLSLLPSVEVTLSDVALSNAEWAEAPNMATVAGIEVEVGLWSLIGGNVVVERLLVREPKLFLEQDQAGRGNWVFEGAVQAEAESAGDDAGEDGGAPPNIRLGDARVENGGLTFIDRATGQTVTADALNLVAALPNIDSALKLDGGLQLNDKPVTIDVSVETPGKAMRKEPFAVVAKLGSDLFKVGYDGNVQQQPVPGLDGRFDLDITSVGELAAWLDQPLDAAQPDPGPVKAVAVFTAEGAKVTLQEATLEGDALQAKATGSLDGSGDVKKVVLNVEAGVLDIDRYLPPPAETAAHEEVEQEAPEAAEAAARPLEKILAGLPDEALDLTPLKQTEADIKITLAGVKAAGFEVGQLALTTTLNGGVLAADLSELSLYGGNVTGQVKLDASGDSLAADVGVKIDKVDVGALAQAAQPGGEAPVGGVASGDLAATTQGASPRALVSNMQGNLKLDLGGLDVNNAQAAALTGLKLELDLPGLDAAPTLAADMVYNRERVKLNAELAPLGPVMAGEPFDASLKVDSALLKAGYAGKVLQQPVPGLDGSFNLDISSVGKLAAWLGQPLADGQPDPGPLTVEAVFAGDGESVTLQEAKITGTDLQATAKGSYDGSGDVKQIALTLESGVLDIDRYLPPPVEAAAESEAVEAEERAAVRSTDDLLAGLSNESFDLVPMRQVVADIKVALGGLKASGFELGRIDFTTLVENGVMTAELSELALYGGTLKGQAKLDGSGAALVADVDVTLDKVDVGALAKAATKQDEAPVAGVASGSLTASGQGASPRALAESLKAHVTADLGGIDVQNEQAAALTELKLEADLPGIEGSPSLKADLVYNQEPVSLDLALAPVNDMLSGTAFPLTAKVVSALVTAAYDGKVQQQPVPGLDGKFDLDIGSVGKLAAWLGQPLPAEQPDPGPLKVAAVFAADGAKIGLNEAKIEGKAINATATGSFDGSGEVAKFQANVNIQELDADAYLPPQAEPSEDGGQQQGEAPAEPAAQGWSEEPIDAAALRQAEGEVNIETGPVNYRGLTIERSVINGILQSGVLSLDVAEVKLAEGSITADATVNGASDTLAFDYAATIEGVQSKPLLSAFSGIDWLSGALNFSAQGSSKGRSQKDLVSGLNGDGKFQFVDGAIEGVNIAEVLRQAKTFGMADGGDETPKTDFSELSGSFVITDGVLDNQDLLMLAPLLRLTGAGQVPLPPQTIDYLAEAKLVGSLEGQGGQEALAGLPIPIRVEGPWSNMSYNIDWESVFQQAATDPERLFNMPADLKDTAKGLGVDLPLPGGEGGLGDVLEKVPGLSSGDEEGASEGGTTGALQKGLESLVKPDGGTEEGGASGDGGAGDAVEGLKDLLGGEEGSSTAPAAPAESAATPESEAPAEAAPEGGGQEPSLEQKLEEPLKELKSLFGD